MNATATTASTAGRTRHAFLHIEATAPRTQDVTAMRHRAARMLTRTGIAQDTADTAELLLGELLANAVRHCRTALSDQPPVSLDISLDGARLTIGVTDPDPRPPQPRPSHTHDEGGRGLTLVDALATAWGCSTRPTSKTVWFTLHSPAPTAPQTIGTQRIGATVHLTARQPVAA
ncbi:ATP-binding protein [Wenjunlia tyrosinilytica]|uniref:Histidine kinase/HSP90-like ATPase domain-containing protein n=1 Tax=Wenjunlia tyrosinilytica TaxID=1544741 RepID=A0A918A0D6_9ACTN|nr:ATP-binding protein [Wenjunlia tyrosinilytica]GGP00899.1 hypothetical protein GCM10012280_70650 [Wenjunlia tyrosinilytica]